MRAFLAVLAMGLFILAGVFSAQAQCGMMGGGDQQQTGMMGGGMGMMGRGMGMGMMRGGMMGGMMDMDDDDHPMWRHFSALKLDDKQKEAIAGIRSKAIKEAIRKRADLKIAMLDLDDLMDKDTADIKAVEAKLRQIEALRTDMYLAKIKAHEEIKARLTPEQKKKLDEMKEKMPMGGRGMMGGMGMMRGGMMGGGMGMMDDDMCRMMMQQGEKKPDDKKGEHGH